MFDCQFAEADLKIFLEIENIRQEWLSRHDEINFYDYGAVAPQADLTQEEMYRGRLVRRPVSELCRQGLRDKWAQTLYGLVKFHKPQKILELGTCCGFSAIYMAKAYTDTTIYTIEGAREIAELAMDNFKKSGCGNIIQIIGRFQDVLPDTLKRMRHVEFVLMDGHHDKEATLGYFRQIKPFLNGAATVALDDIGWSYGMREAWDIIRVDKNVKRYDDLEKMGVVYMSV